MRFEALSRAEQRYEIDGALPRILAEIDRPTPTVIIVARLARMLEADPAYITGLVIAIARDGHPLARKDGETFKRYGRTMRRWTWYPSGETKPLAASVAPVEPANRYAGMSYDELDTLYDAGDQDAWAELLRRKAAETAGQARSPEISTEDW